MRNKTKFFPGIILFILFTFTLLALAEDYLRMIGSDWHPRVVWGKQVTLLQTGDDYPIHIKGYGWKILSKRREKMGIFGKLTVKWGWKIVVHNPGKNPIQFSVTVELKSDEDFVLSSSTLKRRISDTYSVDELFGTGTTPIWEWIHPGRTEVFQNVSQYNASSHKGEGKPNYIVPRFRCK